MNSHTRTYLQKIGTSPFLIPLSIVVSAIIIALGLFFGLRTSSSNTAATAQGGTQQAEQLNTTPDAIKATLKPVETAYVDQSLTGQYPIIIGHADAPVTMHYWYDYQCPFCKAVDVGHPQIPIKPSMAMIIDTYVDTGKVKIEYDSFPFLGNDSITAAEYAHAVWMLYPDKFYEWHTDMMRAQDAEGDTGFGNAKTIDMLINLISGMDDSKVTQYIAANKDAIDAQIAKEQKQGSSKGVTGTPGFLIGTAFSDGAMGPDDFVKAIKSQLGDN